MNQGQEKFLNFILERVEEDKRQDAQNLLAESFAKQADGTFDQEYMQSFMPRMMELIRDDAKKEVLNIMMNFRNH